MPIPGRPNGTDTALTNHSRVLLAAVIALPMAAQPVGYFDKASSLRAEVARPYARSRPSARDPAPGAPNHAWPGDAESMPEPDASSDIIARQANLPDDFRERVKA